MAEPAPTASDFEHPAMELSSPAFQPHGEIPARHTCVGAGLAPPLQWSGLPAGTAISSGSARWTGCCRRCLGHVLAQAEPMGT